MIRSSAYGWRPLRGKRATPELVLHYAVAELLEDCAVPGVLWFHPNQNAGGKMSPQAASRLRRMGVKRGIPDFIILSPAMRNPFCALELKTAKGRLSPEQEDFAMAVRLMGCRYEVARSLEEAQEHLTAFGALRPAQAARRAA